VKPVYEGDLLWLAFWVMVSLWLWGWIFVGLSYLF